MQSNVFNLSAFIYRVWRVTPASAELCSSSHINYLKHRQFLHFEETWTACFLLQRNPIFQTTELSENTAREYYLLHDLDHSCIFNNSPVISKSKYFKIGFCSEYVLV